MSHYIIQYQWFIQERDGVPWRPILLRTHFEADDDHEAEGITSQWVIKNRNWLRPEGNKVVTLWCIPQRGAPSYLVRDYGVPDTSYSTPADHRIWDRIVQLDIYKPPDIET